MAYVDYEQQARDELEGSKMTTRRERLEARAERRRGYAANAEARADAAGARAAEVADGIPFGQPILVGHHSEGRARRDQARIESGMRTAHEEGRKADRHAEVADGIERQLAASIYDDDEDAVERLEAKVARLEEERDRRKRANADYRRDRRAELAALSPYERSQAIPFPSYSISNIGAQIRDARKRVDRLRAEQAVRDAGGRGRGREMDARYGGPCAGCGVEIEKGERIVWFRLTREAVHAACAAAEGEERPPTSVEDEVDAILADAARTFYGESPETERLIEKERRIAHEESA